MKLPFGGERGIMASITVRNIPDRVLERLRVLSEGEKRSLNNEILVILEKGLAENPREATSRIGGKTRLALLEGVLGTWKDDRSTEEIVEDIYASRTAGREVDL
ncbi:MAG: hypothetical protein ABSF43_01595 [Rectinemataceae bacterium]|jgi:plasmid stability protein